MERSGMRSFDFGDGPSETGMEDGDGTVSTRSLRLCEDWIRRLTHRLTVKSFANISHFDIMQKTPVVDAILEQLQLDMMNKCSSGGGNGSSSGSGSAGGGSSLNSCRDTTTSMVAAIWYWQRWRWVLWRHRWGWVPRSFLGWLVSLVRFW